MVVNSCGDDGRADSIQAVRLRALLLCLASDFACRLVRLTKNKEEDANSSFAAIQFDLKPHQRNIVEWK